MLCFLDLFHFKVVNRKEILQKKCFLNKIVRIYCMFVLMLLKGHIRMDISITIKGSTCVKQKLYEILILCQLLWRVLVKYPRIHMLHD